MSEQSTATAALAVSTAGLVVGVFAAALPTLAETRAQADDRGHIEHAQRYAVIVSASLVLGVAGATRSPAAAVVGIAAVVGFAAAYRYAADAQP